MSAERPFLGEWWPWRQWIRKALAMVVAGAAVLTACAAHADQGPRAPKANVAVPVLIYGGSGLADYLTTRGALGRGALEGNPVVRWTGLDTAKLAATAALVFLDMRLQRSSKRGPWVLRALVAGSWTALAVHNHRTNRGPR